MGGFFDKKSLLATRMKLAIAVIFLFIASSHAEMQPGSYFGRTTDPTPVDIAIQDKNEIVRFTIPKVFMTFAKNWDGGLQSAITLDVIYPSMAPVSGTRKSSAGSDVIAIHLHSFASTGGNYSEAALIPRLIKTQWAFVENVTDSQGRSYRMYVYKTDIDKRKIENYFIKEFLVPETDGIYFECLREISNPHVGCIGFMTYGETLSVNYIFRRSEFEQWPEIGKAVVSLLDSFRQPASLK